MDFGSRRHPLRRGIAAIRGVDPDATIITAGLSGWGDSYP
jgi:hypothetical protein